MMMTGIVRSHPFHDCEEEIDAVLCHDLMEPSILFSFDLYDTAVCTSYLLASLLVRTVAPEYLPGKSANQIINRGYSKISFVSDMQYYVRVRSGSSAKMSS